MNVLEDKFYSLKLDIWYKAATFLGIALILIAAENPNIPLQYSYLGKISLVLGAVYLTSGFLLNFYASWTEDRITLQDHQGSEWVKQQVMAKLKPLYVIYTVAVIAGLIAWVLTILTLTL